MLRCNDKQFNLKKENGFKVITNKNEYNTKKIIIAIGRKPMKTGIPGETEYNKKGISYCAICDSHLYKDKDVVVIGDDSLAYNEALYLNDVLQQPNPLRALSQTRYFPPFGRGPLSTYARDPPQ